MVARAGRRGVRHADDGCGGGDAAAGAAGAGGLSAVARRVRRSSKSEGGRATAEGLAGARRLHGVLRDAVAAVHRDRGASAMKDSTCGPQPFDAMADARRVTAVLKQQPPGPGTLHDAETEATAQLWPCKKSQ